MLAVGVLWGPRVQGARSPGTDFAAVLSAMTWLGLAFGAPLVNVVSNRFHSRKWPSVIGMLLQAAAVTLFIYGPSNGAGASVVIMFAVGLFVGTHMLGFTIAGESVEGSLIGSASAIVNGVCFIVGGILEAVPAYMLGAQSRPLGLPQSALDHAARPPPRRPRRVRPERACPRRPSLSQPTPSRRQPEVAARPSGRCFAWWATSSSRFCCAATLVLVAPAL